METSKQCRTNMGNLQTPLHYFPVKVLKNPPKYLSRVVNQPELVDEYHIIVSYRVRIINRPVLELN